ncbi:uncharacterized membrane protein YccF (DUF307 family) [Thermosporothrix hazakensis]|jgi:uncharacterized membrane protein YccF (DUF307 family)|uniref:Uncharacterized membrane protein YccF (DUF307 family) n=2 Tax=Thermosporothrix TaxID=768650 RepID=A0A326UHR7_THEHA|nr:YccF domain-containing protein [Thermosporothrix hazakensis]PZW36410.1 uncharacterized membrane protein YccF (DUF307 family) [Thermosporothrix hazakensis]BBH88877.1 hypothetical protein KTC_36280 [Thermosporothrix sp. COM3]GCE47062.1 hypothetical protein KTH_19310 [Thermosporothrix hazakensis]
MMQQHPFGQSQVVVTRQGPGFLLRAAWFLLLGWWLGLFWLCVGYLLCLTILGLPFGLIMLNRLPQVLTLRPVTQQAHVVATSGGVFVHTGEVSQHPFLLRALYYCLIGFWFGALWSLVAFVCCITVIGLPLGLLMFDRLPAVMTLRRN